MASSRVLALIAAGLSAHEATALSRRELSGVTPVEKVINLMKQLQSQVEEQGKIEAAEYDKFSCFCKEQADGKLYAIDKSKKKMDALSAEISALEADINGLTGEIGELGEAITDLDTKIAEAQKTRDEQHAAYLVEDKDMVDAITAVNGAIEALQASKAKMENAKLDFAQLSAMAQTVMAVASRSTKLSISQESLDQVAALSDMDQAQPAYEYRSNGIIETLETLKDEFIKNKADQDKEEFDLNAEWEKNDLNMKNQKKFAEEAKDQKEKFVQAKTEEKETAQADLTLETKDKDSDAAFMAALTEECEKKASLWDQRSTTRAGELKAINDAMAALEEQVAGAYKANKKLAQVQVSFLQVRGGQASSAVLVDRAVQLLTRLGSKLDSSALMTAAMRIQSNKDHFVKVRQLIKDLVARLEADAQAEADQKSFCDKGMSENVKNRDDAQAEVERLTSEKSKLAAEDAKLAKEISQLATDIANLNKALNEATELRQSESAENQNTVSTAKEGKAGTELALKILNDFYAAAGGASFAQYTPPNADRSGKTVGDLAPSTFSEENKGSQSEAKGIVGLLEVILSDFDRTIETVSSEETTAQEDFDTFKGASEADISSKTKDKETKEARVVAIGDETVTNTDNLKEQNDKLQTSKDSLAALKKECVDGEETYAERVAKRQKEIEALKEAQNILENWQG
eukprot:TRINITY_DN1905_c0_g2_i1.p1 TRINITY_DN1905_c0_g2~~TRINITY_DN1905_c0_g2_i1.p1  ORF type:complete len:690 (-),score=295.61 TRINITY_DN1905_c0_g2_i1:185-2254(-)